MKFFAVIICWVKRPNASSSVIVKSVVWLTYARFFLTLSGLRLKRPNGTSSEPLTQETLSEFVNSIRAGKMPACDTLVTGK